MNGQNIESLKMILLDPLTNFWSQLILIVPNLLGAVLLVVVGYFIAKFSSFLVKKIVEKLAINRLADKSGVSEFLKNIDKELTLSIILAKLLYFVILLSFIMSAAEILKMSILADAFQSILLYLPHIFGSIFVLMFGFFIANHAKHFVQKSASSMNIEFSDALGKVVYLGIAIITLSLAINQLAIETELLNQAISIILGAIGVALALSLGLGTKEISTLIISGNYLRDIYSVGERVVVDDIEGEILSIGTTKTIIKTEQNQEVSISNSYLLNAKAVKL